MIGTIIIAILILLVLILGHELGHFLAAKRAGILVEEFGIGIPPRIWGKKIGETLYSINAIPFGGFVRLHGEDSDAKLRSPTRAFVNKGKLARAFVISAGVFANFLLAVVCFSIVYTFVGVPRQGEVVKVVEVMTGTPAQTAGLIVGDELRVVDNVEVHSIVEFQTKIRESEGFANIGIRRGDENLDIRLKPEVNEETGNRVIGVIISDVETYYPPLWKRPIIGIQKGVEDSLFWIRTIFQGLGLMARQASQGEVPQGVAGPVGIVALISQVVKQGPLPMINLIGILSVNLGILNILPFPALDGGRLLFVGIESLFGRKVVPRIESLVHTVGMIVLLLLILGLTFRDVKIFSETKSFSGYLEKLVGQ